MQRTSYAILGVFPLSLIGVSDWGPRPSALSSQTLNPQTIKPSSPQTLKTLKPQTLKV